MLSVCKDCRHLITEEPHACSSPEYLTAAEIVIRDAAQANVSETDEFEDPALRRQ